jgi:hypothetical protein
MVSIHTSELSPPPASATIGASFGLQKPIERPASLLPNFETPGCFLPLDI